MELIDVIDENNELTGKVADKEEIHQKGLWHREITVIIMNSENKLLLQKRAAIKKLYPNRWSLTAGHIDQGENPVKGALRETEEELGIQNLKVKDFEALAVEKVSDKSGEIINNIYDYIYLLKTDLKEDEFILQESEVAQVKYFSIDEVKNIGQNKEKYENAFTKRFFEESFWRILEDLEKRRN